MTMKRRIERLEQTSPTGTDLPQSVVVGFYTPSASGPELAALQTFGSGKLFNMKREPGEDEIAFRARFDTRTQ